MLCKGEIERIFCGFLFSTEPDFMKIREVDSIHFHESRPTDKQEQAQRKQIELSFSFLTGPEMWSGGLGVQLLA